MLRSGGDRGPKASFRLHLAEFPGMHKCALFLWLGLLLGPSVCAQELQLRCRLLWVGEGCRKNMGVLFNPLSRGFQLDTEGRPFHVTPQVDELEVRLLKILAFLEGWSEVDSRQVVLKPGGREVLPYLDEVEVEGEPWPVNLPIGSEVDLQYQGGGRLRVSCRGFGLEMDVSKPRCRWTTCTREIQLRPGKFYSFAGLEAPTPSLLPNSWLLAGHSRLQDQRPELILLLEEVP